MTDIKLNCPQCAEKFAVSKQDLDETQGLTFCPHCHFELRLTKKAKKNPPESPKQPEAHLSDSLKFREPRADDFFKDSPKSNKPTQKPLTYRIPKADDVFAPVEEPTMFNLLDRDSVNTQLPQISVKPSAAASASASLNTKQDGQQNNITIHTDSLVFTLLGDGQTSPQTPMIAPMQNTTPIAANPPTTPHYIAPPVTTENPMNWTIAVIAALIVLIMQLFYWVLLML